jgi:carboxyl-terminal processing protease
MEFCTRRPARSLRPLKPLMLAAVISGAVALNGCGGGGGSGSPGSSYVSDEVEFLVGYMANFYLFYKDSPAADVTQVTTPEKALELKKAPQDKFSAVTSAAVSTALLDQGSITAFGFNTKLELDKQYRITFVQPNSPAQLAGLARGDAITAIDGKDVASLFSAGTLVDAFGPTEVGVAKTFRILRGTQVLTLPMVKASFPLQSASSGQTFTLNSGIKVGYAYYNSFTTPSVAQWRAAVTAIKTQGASKMIVDLRLNGGGLVSAATALGGTLLTSSATNKPFLALEFNDKNTASNVVYNVPSDSLAGTFDEIVFLTSPSSCSASEALIVGVQPYLAANKVTIIGDTTCGKPFGFTAPTYKGKLYNIISSRIKNSAGFTDYASGLIAKCKVVDTISADLGNSTEALLAAAINYLNTGTCPAVASDTGIAEKGALSASGPSSSRASDYWHLPKENIALENNIL